MSRRDTPRCIAPSQGIITPSVRLCSNAAPTSMRAMQGGRTPLHGAAQHGDRVLVEMLLAKGADPHLENEGGQRPADIALENGHTALAGMPRAGG